jgi:DNA polymerase I-like protein with 3'-5' exonuclease and polymerase domains
MKTISTYVPAFRKVDDRGRLRTSFGYTNTGRWKSRKPNLQNITRDEKFSEEE